MGKEIENDFEPDQATLPSVEDEINIDGSIKSNKDSKLDLIKKNTKWFILSVVGILIVLIFTGVKMLNNTDGKDYYDIVDTIVGTQQGTFTYTIDVRTSAASSGDSISNSNMSDLEDIDSVESTEVSTETEKSEESTETTEKKEEQSKYENSNVDWKTSDGVEIIEATKYLNYKITISGQCFSINPVNLKFDINIATENFNDRFTTVYQVDEKYYIDVEQIRYWLVSSKDAQFISLAKNLPEGKTYLVIEENEFELYSPYAEDADKYDSSIKSLMELYNRFIICEKVVTNNIHNSMGSTGLSSADGVHALKYTSEEQMDSLQSTFANLLYNIGDAHSSVSNSLLSNNIISEDVCKARNKEKDNVMDAFYKLAVAFKTKDLNTAAVGSAREYKNAQGFDTYEATWQNQFTLDGIDYVIALEGTRVLNAEEVTAPNGSTITLKSYGKDLLEDTLIDMMQYLMPVDVKVKNQLAITPESISSDMINSFIKLVNSTTSANTYIDSLSVYDYIEKYANYKVDDNSSESDKVNYKLVSDFISLINDLTGDAVVVEYVTDDTTQQFYTVDKEYNGVEIIANYDQENSESKVTRVHVTLMNRGSSEVTLNMTKFSLQTLISSKYPANNEDLIRGYDTEFNFGLLEDEITLTPNQFKEVDLYFITETGLEYFDLFYEDTNLGELVAY